VLNGEKVPAKEKVVSIFEPHTDIIIKDRRDVLYGHKLCLTTGASSLVVDLVIEDGLASRANLAAAKGRGGGDHGFAGGEAEEGSGVRRAGWILYTRAPAAPSPGRRPSAAASDQAFSDGNYHAN